MEQNSHNSTSSGKVSSNNSSHSPSKRSALVSNNIECGGGGRGHGHGGGCGEHIGIVLKIIIIS